MQELLEHLLLPVLQNPDDLDLRIREGGSSVFIEMKLHPDDEKLLLAEDSKMLFSVRHILSIASGSRKPSLELVSEFIESEEESSSEDSSEDSSEAVATSDNSQDASEENSESEPTQEDSSSEE
jgi:predicted RNA-binding protein YlqC (UPF0109 family)